MTTVEVKKELLSWARERADLPVEKLLKPFPKYQEWENGESCPTLKELQRLASRLYAPLGYFFLKSPPEEKLPIQDFRTVTGEPVLRPSPEMLDTIYAMQQRQEWYKEFLIEEGDEPLVFVASKTTADDPATIANDMRSTLGLAQGWANECRTWTDALDELGVRVEQIGVLTVWNGVVGNNTRRKLDVDEFRGFVLCDSYAPLIFINNADSKSAQMFTLAHELAHVWLGSSGVVNLEQLEPANNDIEKFCNKVAAEFLIPQTEVAAAWESARRLPDPFGQMARRFKVSQLVAARRVLDAAYISKADFIEFYKEYLTDERRKKSRQKKGGDFYNNCNVRIGRTFAGAVLRATHEGKLPYVEAYRLTGLSGTTFDKYFRKIGDAIG